MTSKRIALSVPEDLDEILTRLSRELQKPKTAIITEMLKDALPTLVQVLDAIEESKKGQSQVLVESVAKFITDASASMNQKKIEFEEIRKKHDKPK